MDRAGRNFIALAAIALALVAYGFCALIADGILPLLEGRIEGDGVGLFAVVCLSGLLGASTGLFIRSLRREARATRRLSRRIEPAALPMPATLLRLTREARLCGRVTLTDSPHCCSFVYGLLVPRVAISLDLYGRLSEAELRSVLEHERYHVESLDPLRSALASAAGDALFFLPAAEILRRRYEAARELAADRQAVGIVGPRPLAGALLKAVEGGAIDLVATIPLAAARSIESRLSQLETGREPRLGGAGRRALALSAIGISAFLVLLAGAPLASGGSALATEFGPTALLEGAAFCLAPLAATAVVFYRRLSTGSLGPDL
jgi:beta-lactamase regulating signal transducer with metallopeptidase domain